jgi:hypothetical protein
MTTPRRAQSDKLLREYVSQVLKSSKRSLVEYDGMGDMGYDMGGMGAGGMGIMSYGSPGEFYKIFIQPFADVVGTIAGKTKEVIRSGLTALNVAFESLITSLVPFLGDSYDEIFAKEKSDLAKIRSEYQGYYDSTEKALGGSDAKLLAFMAFPGAALTGKFVSTAPNVAKSILSVASGGYSDELLGGSGGSKRRGPSDMFDSYVRAYNSILTEAEKEEKGPLASKIKSKKFIDTILDRSPAMKESSRFAKQLYLKTLGERVNLVLDIYEAKTLEELGKIIGEPIKVPDMKELDPEQKMSTEETEKKFLEAAKNTSQKAAIGALKKYIQPVQQAFGDDHPFVKDYNSVIDALNSGDVNKIEQVKKQLELSSSKQ